MMKTNNLAATKPSCLVKVLAACAFALAFCVGAATMPAAPAFAASGSADSPLVVVSESDLVADPGDGFYNGPFLVNAVQGLRAAAAGDFESGSAASPVVKVTDEDDNLLAVKINNEYYSAAFYTLEDAFQAMADNTLYSFQYDWQGNPSNYTVYAGGCKFQMLVSSYTQSSSIGVTAQRNVTLTTASPSDWALPGPVSACTVSKGSSMAACPLFSFGANKNEYTETITFSNIVLDGNKPDYNPGYDVADEDVASAAVAAEALATEYGGLVYLHDGATLVVGSSAKLTNGFAQHGGAVYARQDATVNVLDGAEFSGNVTVRSGDGGAIYGGKGTTISIRKATFKNNASGYTGGGAINLSSNKNNEANKYNNVTIEDAYFEDNSSLGTGGAIRACEKTNVTLDDVEFSNNLSVATYYREPIKDKDGTTTGYTDKYSGEGGAVAVLSDSGVNASTLTIYGGLFQDNRVLHETDDSGTHGGGAVKIGGYGFLNILPSQKIADGNAHNARFTGNQADNGGAIIVEPAAKATINSGVEISGNTALFHGGAIYVNGSHSTKGDTTTYKTGALSITGGAIEKNLSYDRGGAVYVSEDATMEMSGGVITNNTSVAGGAVVFGGLNSKVTFTGSPTVFGNDSKNVYLDKDSNALINVGSAGLSDGALVGVYVFATQMSAHGTATNPFGTYANNANLSKFINDRNGLTGDSGQNNTIIWGGQSFAVIKQWGSASDYSDYEIDFKLYRVTGGPSYNVGTDNAAPPTSFQVPYQPTVSVSGTNPRFDSTKPDPNGFFEFEGGWYYQSQDSISVNYSDWKGELQPHKLCEFTGRVFDKTYFEWATDVQIDIIPHEGVTTFLMGDIIVYDGYMWLNTSEGGSRRDFPKNYTGSYEPGSTRGNFTLLGPAEGEPGSGSTPDIDYSDQETAEKEKDKLSGDGYDVDEYTDGSGFVPDKTETKDGTVIYMGHYTLSASDNWMRTFTGLPAGEYYAYEVSVHKKGSPEDNLIDDFDVSYQYIQDGKKVIMRNGVEEGDDVVEIGFKKVDSYGNALPGAEFALYTSKGATDAGERVALGESGATTVTSNANGEVKLTLPVGVYYMREVSTPAGHDANGNVYVVLAGETYMTAGNLRGSEFANISQAAINDQNNVQGSVAKNYAIFQLDASGNAMASPNIAANGLMNVRSDKRTTIVRKTNSSYGNLAGAQFTVFSADWSQKELGTDLRASNANGYTLVRGLNYGTYYLQENVAPDNYGNNAGSYYKLEVRADTDNSDGTVTKGITVQRVSNVASEQNRNVVVTSGGGSTTSGKPTYEIRLDPAKDGYLVGDTAYAKLQEMVNGTVRNSDFTDAVTWRVVFGEGASATIGVANGALQLNGAGSVVVIASIGGIPVAWKEVLVASPTALEVSGSVAKQPAGNISINDVRASDNGQDLSNSVEWHAYTGSDRATSTDVASVATKNATLTIENEGTYYLFARDPSTGKWSSSSIQFQVGADVTLSANAATVKPGGEAAFTVKYGSTNVTDAAVFAVTKQGGGSAPTVGRDGKATFPDEGTYTVTATYRDKAATSSVTITVKSASAGFTMVASPATLQVGDYVNFTITDSQGDSITTPSSYTWDFDVESDGSLARQNDGRLRAVKSGTYTVTLTKKDNDLWAYDRVFCKKGDSVQCEITIAANPLYEWQALPASSYSLTKGPWGQYPFTVNVPEQYRSMGFYVRITTNIPLTGGWGGSATVSGNTFTADTGWTSKCEGTMTVNNGDDLQIEKVEILGKL